jgi:flavodoxin
VTWENDFIFPGTGNSRYIAQVIQSVTRDEIVSINNPIKSSSKDSIKSESPLVFVAPIYAYRIPKIVDKFIRETSFEGNKKAYFVSNCGSGAGNAVAYIKNLFPDKGFDYQGFASIVMPENYVALFSVPEVPEAEAIIQEVMPQIHSIAETIKNQQILKEN